MRKYLFLLVLSAINVNALEVVKPEFNQKIELRIIRAEPDSFESYTLLNHNGREMTLVCSNNRAFDNNPLPILKYRNFYNEEAGDFILNSEKVCKELGKFIESVSAVIDDEKPFLITLDPKSMKVAKVVYPNINPYTDEGYLEDLLPKKPLHFYPKSKELQKKGKRKDHRLL